MKPHDFTHAEESHTADALDLVEYALGGGSDPARERTRRDIAGDLGAALEFAEVKDLFESMRELRGAPSGNLLPRLEREFAWRSRLLARGASKPRFPLRSWIQVAAVAALWLFVSDRLFLCVDSPQSNRADVLDRVADFPGKAPGGAPRVSGTGALAGGTVLSVDAASFGAAWTRLASRPLPANFADWANAERVLEKARAVAALRASPQARAQWRNQIGAADVGSRVASLAAEVAARARAALASPDRDAESLAFALRGLLAAGASGAGDESRELLHALCSELVADLGGLDEGPRACALSALAEFAVESEASLRDIVAREADALIASTCTPRADHLRPALLRWNQPAYRIAEAGRLLLLAPAFGSDAAGAFRARLLLAAHLEERAAQHDREEMPELSAAALYGFADLIDCQEADRRLALWPARLILPDYLAVTHLTWGSYPIRHGWAALQDQIRGLSGVRTPNGILDSAALLLALCSDVASADALRTPLRIVG